MTDNPNKKTSLPWYLSFAVWSWLFPVSMAATLSAIYIGNDICVGSDEVDIIMPILGCTMLSAIFFKFMSYLRDTVYVVRCMHCGWEFRVKTFRAHQGRCPACDGDVFSYRRLVDSEVISTTQEHLGCTARIRHTFQELNNITGAELLKKLDELTQP